MAYDKLKEEMYMNVGGINQKAIDSATPTNDVLDLVNFSFARPGGWESRPGYSMCVNTSLVTKVTGMWEYTKLTGESYFLVSGGATLLSYTNTTPTVIRNDLNSSPVDMLTFVNFAWGTDGGRQWKLNGSTSTLWQMPYMQPDVFSLSTSGEGVTLNTGLGLGGGATTDVSAYSFKLAYVNERGVIGPIYPDLNPGQWINGNLGLAQRFITAVASGQWQIFGFTVPPGFGISAIAVFMKSFTGSIINDFVGGQSHYSFSLSPGGYIVTFPHFTDGNPISSYEDTMGSSVVGQGNTFYSNIGTLGFTPGSFNPSLLINMETPKYQQIYNNMMLYGGFSSSPSFTRVSEIGEPEKVLVENVFETRTNDGDKINGYAVFQGNALIFKERTVAVLNGFSTDELSQQIVTTNYGCINNRAIVEFENRLFFLDTEGIAEFNGVNTDIVSHKMEETFKRMNLSVARDTACAVHLKDRNEVWFMIPLDSSTVNNCVVVYDYVVDGWTKYEGFTPYFAYVGKAMGVPKETIFFGNYTGSIFAFGESLFSDNGSAISMMIQTRFHKRLGDSTQEMWRRFYINNSVPGTTTPITLDFLPNYGSASSLGLTVFANATFQNRVDFGLSAKTMSAQIKTSSSTHKIKILGYTIESRYQRSV